MLPSRPCTSFLRLALGIIAFACLSGGVRADADDAGKKFERWEKAIAALEEKDRRDPPPDGSVFFLGSSSIVLWDLEKAFPGIPVVNRGFGGSRIADSTHFAGRLLRDHRPRMIVFYAGDNDIAGGRSAEQVEDDFRDFVKAVRERLPEAKIAFLAIKPSPSRWKFAEEQRKANARVEAYCKAGDRLEFVDTFTPMLGEDGMPRVELYRKDRLHLSDRGYEVWNEILAPRLK